MKLEEFAKRVTKLAKKNVVDRKINSSGRGRKSIGYKIKKGDTEVVLSFEMEDYMVLRDAGQLGHKRKILKGWNKSIFTPRGKGFTSKFPKVDAIKTWIRTKPIRSDLSLNSLSYLIGRKIYNEGIQPGLFFSDPFNSEFKKLPDELINELDIEKMLDDENN